MIIRIIIFTIIMNDNYIIIIIIIRRAMGPGRVRPPANVPPNLPSSKQWRAAACTHSPWPLRSGPKCPPDEWTHSPWPLRRGLKTSIRSFKTRSQPSLDAKERFCKNACFPIDIQGFSRVGWPSCAVNIPFFRSEAATASHLDSKIQRNP